MEAAREQEATGLLGKILPPRLEDAGLEDCALPPDSIHEAFLKAASAVNSLAPTLFNASDDETNDGDCVTDPWPNAKDTDTVVGGAPPCPGASDTVVGVSPGDDEAGPCLAGKGGGGLVEEGEDAVVVGGGLHGVEKEGENKGCVEDELKGLEIEGKVKDEDEEERES